MLGIHSSGFSESWRPPPFKNGLIKIKLAKFYQKGDKITSKITKKEKTGIKNWR